MTSPQTIVGLYSPTVTSEIQSEWNEARNAS